MKVRYTLLCLLVVVASVHAPTALATDNEPPVVDAGLDQSVAIGATVYLDAGGSYDPDGTIRSYEWTIRGPNGTRTTPDCPTCERTSFVPDDPGTYAVTLRATDDDGATRNDTLYVEVRPGTGPTLTLSAPASATAGDPVSVTAAVDAGTASLDGLRWRVNGVDFGTDDLRGDTATVSRAVPTAGGGEITVRAVVVDDAGLRETASTRISVSPPPGGGVGGSTDPAPNDSPTNDTEPTPGNGTAPGDPVAMSVRGPTLVTGDQPLRGNYSLSVGDGDAAIRSVGWYVDGDLVGGGRSTPVTFDPGRHDLVARVLTDDGSRTVTFSDGRTEVVADPAPTVAFDALSTDGTIVSGRASASDEFGSLEEFYVAVDGTRIANASYLILPGGRNRLLGAMPFRHTLAANESYDISVTAVDDRGQTATVTREVTTGAATASGAENTSRPDRPEPSVVSSEFVNDPVDSYHERIGADRYLAQHVTKIDLDGADPSSVEVAALNVAGDLLSFPSRVEKRYDDRDDLLVIRSYFAAREPGEYTVDMRLTGSNGTGERFRSLFEVTPSKPVPRLDVTRSGTGPDVQNWGMVVDASESFDPDGTEIDFEWIGGAKTLEKPSIAKFDARDRAQLLIEDENENSVRIESGFLDYYNPGLQTIEVTSTDGVSRSGDVYFRISTPTYAFTKQTYDADLSVTVVGDGRVIEWSNVDLGSSGTDTSSPGSPEDATEQRYTGLVVIDRDEFDDGDRPKIRIYNDAQPETTAMEYPISPSDVRGSEAVRREGVTVERVRYEVETDRYETYVTSSPDEKARYVADGYEVVEQRREPVEYELERGLVRWETETERRAFDSQEARERFLTSSRDEWRSAGTDTTTERRLVTKTVWRDSLDGEGTFTGETKRVVPAYVDRRTEFEYIERVNKTVEITETVLVPLPGGGMKTVEQTREKTVTRTQTYWATTPKSTDHVATGASRQVIPDGAYETRYEHTVERYERVEVTEYVVERTTTDREMVWVDAGTADGDSQARQRVRVREDLRIVNTKLKTEWVLRGTENRTIVRDEYSRETEVNRTIVYVSGEVRDGEDTWEFRERLTFDGALTEAEIRARIEGSEGEQVCGEDDPVTSGCGVEE